MVMAGLAPRARSTSSSSAVEADPPPDHLAGDEERGQAGDPAEDAQGDRLRPERALRPRLDVGGLDVGEGHTLGEHAGGARTSTWA